ncbi:5-formyltetrahydrofolate cyclo-ligase [Rhizorhabdus argentea]|uniref:5-formyltetrahydrofolate cyclo-ligase n=1 Tax=Rhizorhabdus argentea TaxID=1387174 RepID=UPI0030EDB8CF
MIELSKPAQRAELRAARDGFVLDLTGEQRARLEARAAANLMPLIEKARCVAFYHGLGGELGCGPAITAAAARGIAVALPHVAGRHQAMRFLSWAPGNPLETGWRGLQQPLGDTPELIPDVIVTPLLGFDSTLARLGQGAGFYDRAFAERPVAAKIGFGWSIQRVPVIACDPWDVRLDAVVTEAGTIGKGEQR